MVYYFQPNLSGLLLQALGTLLLASLCLALLRTVPRPPLMFSAAGWAVLFVSLATLWLGMTYRSLLYGFQAVYLFGEYVFGYLVIAGARNYALGEWPRRREWALLVPAVTLVVGLPRVARGDADVFFALHTLIFPYLFFTALRVLRGVTPQPRSATGLRVMKLALLLLTIDYLHYAPFFAAASYQNLRIIDTYIAYAPLYDLIFQVMLVFGMVMVTTGDVQHQLEAANADLQRARDEVEMMSRMDPLTSALNRRAFSAVVEARSRGGRALVKGAAAGGDLDNLKTLNDAHGHGAGDVALQVTAAALRSCMRDGDLLFRWGGDEFVVLFDQLNESEALGCLAGLNDKLARTAIRGVDEPVDLRASVGVATFDSVVPLDEAIARADHAMYRRKKSA